jgi:tetratricopeptide (TPR) repeat protein
MHFGILVPLAAAGVVLTWAQRRRHWVLYALLLVSAAAVAVFYVFARYRYPLVPVTALFAGAAVGHTIDALRGQRWRRLLLAGAVAAPVAVVANLPLNPRAQLDAAAWGNLGSALARQGNYQAAVIFFERAVRGSPYSPEMHYNLGLAYTFLGRYPEAVTHLEYAVQAAPSVSEAHYQLGVAKELLGNRDAAAIHYRRTLELSPHDPDAMDALQRLERQKVPTSNSAADG